MNNVLTQIDHSPALRGHFRIEVYEGDPPKTKLSMRERIHNALMDLRWKLLGLPADVYYRPRILAFPIQVIEKDNLVVTLGKQIAMDRLFGLSSVAALTHMGVGTDSTAAAVGQTKLNPSVAGSVSFLAFDSTPTRSSQTVTAVRTWDTATGNFSWNELGLANSATNDGTHLFNRIVIGPFAKSSAVSIVVTCTITQS